MLQFSPFDFIAKIVTIKIHFRYSISLFRAISIFGENDIHVYTKTHFLMIFFYDIKILLMKYKKKKLGNISHAYTFLLRKTIILETIYLQLTPFF